MSGAPEDAAQPSAGDTHATKPQAHPTPPPPTPAPRHWHLSAAAWWKIGGYLTLAIISIAFVHWVWPRDIAFPIARSPAPGESYCTMLSQEASVSAGKHSYVAVFAVIATVLASSFAVSFENKPETRIPILAFSMLCASLGLYCFARAEAAGEVVASVTNARFPENGDVPNDGVALALCARARAEWERSRASANQVVRGILEDRLRRANEMMAATASQAQTADQEREQSQRTLDNVERAVGQAASAAPSGSAAEPAKKLADEVKALTQPALGQFVVIIGTDATEAAACADVKKWPSDQPSVTLYKTLSGNYVSMIGPYPTREIANAAKAKVTGLRPTSYAYPFSRSWLLINCVK